eukprot:645342-Rhodomonas_salina.2
MCIRDSRVPLRPRNLKGKKQTKNTCEPTPEPAWGGQWGARERRWGCSVCAGRRRAACVRGADARTGNEGFGMDWGGVG